MQLDWALLADSAQVRDNLGFMLGAGFDTIQTEQLPASLHGAILLRLLFHRTEVDRDHAVDVRILDEDGAEMLRLHRHVRPTIPDDLPLGWDVPMLLTFGIRHLELPRAGRYSVEVLADAVHQKSLNLRVKLITQGAPTQR